MKNKINSILTFLAFSVFLLSSFSVFQRLDFTTEVIEISDNRIDITVTISSGEPEFTYSVWDGEPWENGIEIESSGKISSIEYTFRNLIGKPYFIMVSDKNNLRRVYQIEPGKTVQLKAN